MEPFKFVQEILEKYKMTPNQLIQTIENHFQNESQGPNDNSLNNSQKGTINMNTNNNMINLNFNLNVNPSQIKNEIS